MVDDENPMTQMALRVVERIGKYKIRDWRVNPDVPVILSSGYNRAEAFRYFSSKGFDGFLQKPYDLVNLRNALEKVIKS